jgi:hypothetical protein
MRRADGRGYALPELAEAIENLRLPGSVKLSLMGARQRASRGPVE